MPDHQLLRGRLRIIVLGRGLLLFDLESLFEAEWVLTMGKRRVKESLLHLEKWNLTMRCFHKGAYANKNVLP